MEIFQQVIRFKRKRLNRSPKKTLAVDFPLEEIPFPVSGAAVSISDPENQTEFTEEIIEPEFIEEKPPVGELPVASTNQTSLKTEFVPNPSFAENAAKIIESIPIKLPPISSEELEHIEDNWLDDAFERKLQQLGDDLSPIKNAAQIVELLFGENQQNSFMAKIETSTGGAATAFAPAKNKPSFVIPNFDQEEISSEIPVLPENPTEEQLWEHAQNHPMVKKAIRILRGKILEVKRDKI